MALSARDRTFGMFVGAEVVQYQMEPQLLGELIIQLPQESQELLVAMSWKALADDFTFEDFQRRE